ncbi:hypothetical protein [Candidatus Nitrosocosmicus sp. T]
MKSRSLGISEISFVVIIISVALYFDYMEKKNGNVDASSVAIDELKHNYDRNNNNSNNNSSTKGPLLLINTTNVSNCFSPSLNDRSVLNSNSDEKHIKKLDRDDLGISITNSFNTNSSKFCKVYTVSDPSTCIAYFVNQSKKSCHIDYEDEDEDKKLETDNFSNDGLLIADTKFNNQYTFESLDPLNPTNKIRVSLDFDEHTQGGLEDLNSPRIELVRESLEGEPNMSAAKNQIIKWQGNIGDYFKEPIDDFDNETYITIQFNTGRHTSDEDDQRNGFGVLFDVSADSNPNLFEFREDGHYVKYDYEMIKQLTGDSFKFHNKDKNGNPVFINELTETDNVTLKVVTYLDANNSRTVKTFIDKGQGKEVPYWTIDDLSKLKEYDKVDNDDDFIRTVMQGSGYVIARTDNIDTRLSSFNSLAF